MKMVDGGDSAPFLLPKCPYMYKISSLPSKDIDLSEEYTKKIQNFSEKNILPNEKFIDTFCIML